MFSYFWKWKSKSWRKERDQVMSRLDTLEARMQAAETKLAEIETGLRQDVTTLKAIIDALRAQAADPALLDRLETLMTGIETRVTNLTALDAETEQTPPV
jgi:signal transduction histidine kinase